MKKLNIYDQLNAAALLLVSPEWRKVKAARKSAVSFETPDVTMPTETRTIAGRNIRLAQAGPADAPLVVLLSPFPESILSFTGSWEALTEKCRVIAIDLPGFGASEGDRKDMTPTAQGAHLAAIFEELELNNIHLVAPDVGMAALLYTSDAAATPSRLVLVGARSCKKKTSSSAETAVYVDAMHGLTKALCDT